MRKAVSALIVSLSLALIPGSLRACAICFGELNINMSKAFFWGVLLLLGLPFALVAVLIGLVVHHSRKHQRQQDALTAHRAS